MKTVIKNFIYRNERFVIAKDNGYYLAINYKDIDKNGALTRQLNGLQMHASEKLSLTLDQVKNSLDIKAYGFTKDDLMTPNLLTDVISGKYRA